MERLVMLGTGNALVTNCYNTCFVLSDGEADVLVDAGGGNGILHALAQAGFDAAGLHELYVTHGHCDHVLGVVWVLRMVATAMRQGRYEGVFRIHCHRALAGTIATLAELTLEKKFTDLFGERILFCPVEDGEERQIGGSRWQFFDIRSTKLEQYGFTAALPSGKLLCCLGDEPCSTACEEYVRGCDWLLAEAFCLYGDRKRFKPYEKHHSTVKEACELAERLEVKNLVLYHTEDETLFTRRERYLAEGKQYYNGSLFVPDDLESIVL